MTKSWRLKQPWLGMAGMTFVVALALTVCAAFEPTALMGWVSLLVMSCIPMQMIIGLVWQHNYPRYLKELSQPLKGLTVLALMASAGMITTGGALWIIGGGAVAPTPFVVMYIILSIVATMWMGIVWQAWPARALASHPAAVGLCTLLLAHMSAWLVLRVFFNFEAMAGAPFYDIRLDPKGLLPAWTALSFFVSTGVVIMVFVALDFWPLSVLGARWPRLMDQPIFGSVAGAMIVIVAFAMWTVCVGQLDMDPVIYMVRVSVSLGFGIFIMVIGLRSAPVQTARQPVKGVVVLGTSAVLALGMYRIYEAASLYLNGPMARGAPGYDHELWLATAMLSITFPIIVAYADGFEFWPIAEGDGQSE